MIQRIQTIFLFIAFSICGLIIVMNPVYAEFEYSIGEAKFQAVFQFWSSFGEITDNNGLMIFTQKWIQFGLLAISGSLSFISIFIFRKFHLQVVFIISAVLLNVILGVLMIYQFLAFKNQFNSNVQFDINAHIFWIVLILALNALALFAIRLDRRNIPQNYFGFPKG